MKKTSSTLQLELRVGKVNEPFLRRNSNSLRSNETAEKVAILENKGEIAALCSQ